MKILFDINHPAHVHFFKNPARILKNKGHKIFFTSRRKECTVDLLNKLGLDHQQLSGIGKGGAISLTKELFLRNHALYKFVKDKRPHVMASIGGTFIAHVGALTRVPSVVFYDTENAVLQNLITYPLATRIYVPRCYNAWLPKKAKRYAGYHELSYLAPKYFTPNSAIAEKSGIIKNKDNFLIRTVSWDANHDLREAGWNRELLTRVVEKCLVHGNVIISSESELDYSLKKFQYRGSVFDIHHVMAFCRGFVGESATMGSECAVLGVPAIYAARTGRGYTEEQEGRYGLVMNVYDTGFGKLSSAIDRMLDRKPEEYKKRRNLLLNDTIDVAEYVVTAIEKFL